MVNRAENVKQVYRALSQAAARIGQNNYRRGLYHVKKDRRGRLIEGYSITPAHERVIKAMSALLDGHITPDEAMAILWEPDVMQERF